MEWKKSTAQTQTANYAQEISQVKNPDQLKNLKLTELKELISNANENSSRSDYSNNTTKSNCAAFN